MKTLDHVKTLAQLLRLAYKDMKKIKADKRYSFNLDVWHDPNWEGLCSVCIAGSIMANTLNAPRYEWVAPSSFNTATEAKLVVIDLLRIIEDPPSTWDRFIKEANFDSVITLDNIQELTKGLSKSGLYTGDSRTWLALVKRAEKMGL